MPMLQGAGAFGAKLTDRSHYVLATSQCGDYPLLPA